MRTRASGPAAAFWLAAACCAAQTHATPAAAPLAPDVFGGYSYTKGGEASLNGVGLSGSYPVGRRISLVLDVSAHSGSFAGADLGQRALMAGARYSLARGRLRPFGEALVGGVRTSVDVDTGGGRISEADTDWGVAPGAGLDYRVAARWSARALFQLRLLSGESGWDADPRLALGVAYRLRR